MRLAIIVSVLVLMISISAFGEMSGKIVFTSNRNGNADVYIINADGTGEKQLTDDDSYDDQPVLSPDGSMVVYISGYKSNNDVWLVESGGGGKERVAKTDAMEYDPSFSPDGESVIFTRVDGDSKKIVSRDLSSGAEEELADGYMARMSSDGALVYVNEESGNEELYIKGANLTNSAKSDTFPSFSPDGSQIIFTSRREGDYDTYIMDRDGSSCKALLSSENDEGRAVISPDGEYIAVSVEESDGTEVIIYDFNGNFVRKLTDNEYTDYEPHWGK